MEPSFSVEEQEEQEEQKKREVYEKHKCRYCEWATWQQEVIVVCLFPSCVKDKGWDSG